MKNPLVLSLALLAGTPLLARGQGSGTPETAPSAAQQVVEEIGLDRLVSTTGSLRPADARNLSVLRQSGQGNQAAIEQVSQGQGINQALIVQVGNANIVDLNQSGNRNNATLMLNGDGNTGSLNQNGSNNTFTGRVVGNGNDVDVVQNGQNNRSTMDVATNDRKYSVLQTGNRNELTQREAAGSTAPLGYSVEMRGNGIRLTIEQGRAQP